MNQISFRFNHTDGVSIGFRVLNLQFYTAQGKAVLPPSSFVTEDPSRWSAPLADDADIAAGSSLWHNGGLLESNLVGAPRIRATCSACHTQDGRDLKFFNYSNYSIIERTKFHGLSEQQGKQIASYIRTLKNADGTEIPTPGRPWNPPYQPGHGLDAAPAANWAAGAGLGAVLNKDSDMLPYLFPGNSITASAVSYKGHLNIRELPISIQLLDWNHWLPRVYPGDAYPDFEASTFKNFDGTLRWALSSNRTANLSSGWVSALVDAFNSSFGSYYLRYDLSHNSSIGGWTPESATEAYSLSQWKAVKMFEIVNEFSLQGSDTRKFFFKAPYETRGWPQFDMFTVSPAGIPQITGVGGETEASYELTANAWYWMQAVINPGNRQVGSTTHPIDWPYMTGRIKDLGSATQPLTADRKGVWEDMRMYSLTVLGMQQGDGVGLSPQVWSGWHPGSEAALTVLTLDQTSYVNDWHDFTGTPAQRRQMLDVLLQNVVAKNRTFPAALWYRNANGAIGEGTPTDVPGMANGDTRYYVNNVYSTILTYQKLGVPATTVNSLADWATGIWPNYKWAALKK